MKQKTEASKNTVTQSLNLKSMSHKNLNKCTHDSPEFKKY